MEIRDVYQNYYQYIFNYALKLTCHPEDALDVTQDTFLKAMEKLNTLENENALASWLRTICFREFVNRAQKDPKKYLTEPVEWEKLEAEGILLAGVTPQPEEEVIVAEEIRNLQNGCFLAMVRKLTLHQRIVFSLVDMYGLPIEHAAGYTGGIQRSGKRAAVPCQNEYRLFLCRSLRYHRRKESLLLQGMDCVFPQPCRFAEPGEKADRTTGF